jgi:tetratricopeptide (TPR) repeat protein
MGKNDRLGAIAAYRNAVECDRTNATFHFRLGELLEWNGMTNDAVESYRNAIDIDRNHYMANLQLGIILCDVRRDYERAADVFKELIRINQKDPRGHYNLGIARMNQGRLREAVASFREASVVNPKASGAHQQLAWILATGPDDVRDGAEAVKHATRACELTGWKDTSCIFTLAAAYEQAGQLDKAEDWRRQLLAVVKKQAGADSPAYAGELAALGLNLLKQKKQSDAEPVLRESLAIREKTQPDAWTTFNTQSMLGGALLGQKKYAEAEPLLLKGYDGMKAREKTIPKTGGAELRIPEALDRLIELYTATDRPEEAKKWRAERAKYPNLAPPPREKK